MRYAKLAIITAMAVMIAHTTPAQTATSAPEIPPNAIVTVANGVELIFVPGPNPTIMTRTMSADVPPGLAVAASNTVRFVDKHGRAVDPASIKPTESLQPIADSGPNGRVLQTVMVDRD